MVVHALGKGQQEKDKETRLSYTVRPCLKRRTGKNFNVYGCYHWNQDLKHDDKIGAMKFKQLFVHSMGHVGPSPNPHHFQP